MSRIWFWYLIQISTPWKLFNIDPPPYLTDMGGIPDWLNTVLTSSHTCKSWLMNIKPKQVHKRTMQSSKLQQDEESGSITDHSIK